MHGKIKAVDVSNQLHFLKIVSYMWEILGVYMNIKMLAAKNPQFQPLMSVKNPWQNHRAFKSVS